MIKLKDAPDNGTYYYVDKENKKVIPVEFHKGTLRFHIGDEMYDLEPDFMSFRIDNNTELTTAMYDSDTMNIFETKEQAETLLAYYIELERLQKKYEHYAEIGYVPGVRTVGRGE